MGIFGKLFGALKTSEPEPQSTKLEPVNRPDATLVRAAFHAWMLERLGIDVKYYQQLTRDDLKNNGDFVFHSQKRGPGTTYQKGRTTNPDFFVRYLGDGKPNSMFFEYTITTPEGWSQMETMIRELSSITGDEICSEKEFATMRKGRMQHGRQFTIQDGFLFGITIDWKYVSVVI